MTSCLVETLKLFFPSPCDLPITILLIISYLFSAMMINFGCTSGSY